MKYERMLSPPPEHPQRLLELVDDFVSAGESARPALPHVLTLASDRVKPRRYFAYLVLPWLDRGSVCMPWLMVAGMHDDGALIRETALAGLIVCKSKPKELLQHVARLLYDEDDLVRIAAVEVMEYYGKLATDYIDHLEAMLGADVEDVDHAEWDACIRRAISAIRGW